MENANNILINVTQLVIGTGNYSKWSTAVITRANKWVVITLTGITSSAPHSSYSVAAYGFELFCYQRAAKWRG